ncbi:DUF4336 domain-containing protein [Oscillatoria sp. FACHB-1407]|uniref:DUF4336 domain-containing protein n=1 Tax=Oscillatoria sp. FACHB-1407 TaxID=2692847 RepID=UPI001681F9AB|nr:DUF4336 domain-containing protein [Oscillatoria sp. FACHB-1407]MBD2465896.1 DUF4336 domain-containing protein [Oscillatoria sp. FACHB-1407]
MTTQEIQQPELPNLDVNPQEWSWSYWFVVPLYPYSQRRTLRKEVVKDTVWTFEQIQGIFYVVVPIRMTVVRLESGGLLVYAPIAPTRECIRLLNELTAQHGDVKYIILPTVSGIEHKVFVGPFARFFPNAQVFVAPNQWSFPINLPLSWLGFPRGRTHTLPENSQDAPFSDEFDYAVLTVDLGRRWFGEVALLHRRSHTLLVTDSIVSIPDEPPEVVQLDPYPLLFHAKDSAADPVRDIPANRRKGWHRVTLFALYFQPQALATPTLLEAVRESFKAPDRSKKAYFGLFPFRWKPDWQAAFKLLSRNGQLLVAPILQALILNRAPKETIAWANQVASWDFQQIIPCHFDAPIAATPQQFRQAFAFLEKQPLQRGLLSDGSWTLPKDDIEFLNELSQTLTQVRVVPPAQDKV